MDAGFLSVVESGQYFMTKDTAEFSPFHAVACREYTLPRDDETSQPRGWIQGNTRIGPVLEVTTSYLHGKYGVEIRIWSLNGDSTHSLVRISHESNKFVMDSNNNDTEVPEDQLEEHALQLDAKEFVSQPKVIYLLRLSQKVHREVDGAVHFWRIKENLQNPFPQSIHWSDDRWKACLAAGGGAKRRFQYCTDDPGIIIYFRALQGHSGRNLIDLSLQDNVVIPSGFFQYVYHFGCAFNLHSVINSGLIPGGQKFKQETDSILFACWSRRQRAQRSLELPRRHDSKEQSKSNKQCEFSWKTDWSP